MINKIFALPVNETISPVISRRQLDDLELIVIDHPQVKASVALQGIFDRIGKWRFQPSLFGIESGEFHHPSVYDSFQIATISSSCHGIHKLVKVLTCRDNQPLHSFERSTDNMILTLHFFSVRFIHTPVDITVETAAQREQK